MAGFLFVSRKPAFETGAGFVRVGCGAAENAAPFFHSPGGVCKEADREELKPGGTRLLSSVFKNVQFIRRKS